MLTLFVKGHLVDPLQNAAYQSLKQLRRMAELERDWSCYANGGEMSDGPVATMHSILQRMGWHWHTPTLFMREGPSQMGLLEGPESW